MSRRRMESCNHKIGCLPNHVTRHARKGLLDNVPDLPIQVGRPDFTRLRDRSDNNYVQPNIEILTNAYGAVNGQILTHSMDSDKLAFVSNDAQWTAVNISATSYQMIGPETGEIFLGQLTAIKPA